MKKEDFEKDLMPPELVLKLTRDIPSNNYKEKLSLLHEHFEKLKASNLYHAEVLELKKDEQIAFIYWDASQFEESAFYYEKILNSLTPELAPNSYSMATFMVIRSYRLNRNYSASALWAEKILDKPELLSSFSKLDALSEYVDLINETLSEFNRNYVSIILQIITELGFPVEYKDNPVESIAKIKELNRKWNLKMPTRRLPDSERKKSWEEYINECEVGWYKNYAKERLDEMINE